MQCSICFEPYDTRRHRPKIVPCGHTFCLQCLMKFRSKECPTCRLVFKCPPVELTDNFLALDETPDMKFMQRSLWCHTCNDTARLDCVESHEICSAQSARTRLMDELVSVLRAEQTVLHRETEALAQMDNSMSALVNNLWEQAEAASTLVTELLREGGAGKVASGINAVKAVQSSIRASESRAAALQDALCLLNATEAEIKVKCGGEWRSFLLDLSSNGNLLPEQADNRSKLILFMTFALSRNLPPNMSRNSKYEVTATVRSRHLGPLPDVIIEFDEMPVRTTLEEQWSKGWRRYSICGGCLESCHTEIFTPQPPAAGDGGVAKGTVCVGRSSCRFYFILCDDMGSKFCLPLAASFKVVGRVTRNLSSLEEAVKSMLTGADLVEIVPNVPIS